MPAMIDIFAAIASPRPGPIVNDNGTTIWPQLVLLLVIAVVGWVMTVVVARWAAERGLKAGLTHQRETARLRLRESSFTTMQEHLQALEQWLHSFSVFLSVVRGFIDTDALDGPEWAIDGYDRTFVKEQLETLETSHSMLSGGKFRPQLSMFPLSEQVAQQVGSMAIEGSLVMRRMSVHLGLFLLAPRSDPYRSRVLRRVELVLSKNRRFCQELESALFQDYAKYAFEGKPLPNPDVLLSDWRYLEEIDGKFTTKESLPRLSSLFDMLEAWAKRDEPTMKEQGLL